MADCNLGGRKELEDYFGEHGIAFCTKEHPEVFTVEAMLPYLEGVEGAIVKNLFLKDKKKNLYLFSCVHDTDVKLNDLGKLVKASGGLRFADESVLYEKLGVKQGCVTALALFNDNSHHVKFICDGRLLDGSFPSVNFHPMVNTASTNISCDGFKLFLEKTGHEPIVVDLNCSESHS